MREWLRLKAALSTQLIADWAEAVQAAAAALPLAARRAGGYALHAHAFMPPFSTLTGLDFAAAAPLCAVISPKLYCMHCETLSAASDSLTFFDNCVSTFRKISFGGFECQCLRV